MAHRLTIPKKTLLEGGFKWKAEAKEFIQACVDNSVDLLQATENYHTRVVQFYEWVASKQREIHRQDYEIVSQAQEELLVLMAPEVPAAISERRRFLPKLGTIFNVLGVYLTRKQDAEIAHLVGKPVEWAESALRMLQKNVPLAPELIESIMRHVHPAVSA